MDIRKIFFVAFLMAGMIYGQGSHNVMQQVFNWPAGQDTTGKNWLVYNPNSPWVKVLTDTSVGSSTVKPGDHIWWIANTGNFPGSPPWTPGDTIISFGSWDSCYANNPSGYGDNTNHTGFYWLFSDSLTTEEPQTWLPEDTLRMIPKPIAYVQNPSNDVDTIVIKFPNPMQTQSGLGSYEVVGYELYVAENSGTPNNFLPIAFVPCQGVFSDTTVYKDTEDNYPNGSVIYYAYKIVVRKN